jgi:hypothetical protein
MTQPLLQRALGEGRTQQIIAHHPNLPSGRPNYNHQQQSQKTMAQRRPDPFFRAYRRLRLRLIRLAEHEFIGRRRARAGFPGRATRTP